jgi:ssDNA-binding Zn-finger/Zn-ribbon topoisomerase 1
VPRRCAEQLLEQMLAGAEMDFLDESDASGTQYSDDGDSITSCISRDSQSESGEAESEEMEDDESGDEEENDEAPFHCDACHRTLDLADSRFHCLICSDFDLCETCHAEIGDTVLCGKHVAEHPMICFTGNSPESTDAATAQTIGGSSSSSGDGKHHLVLSEGLAVLEAIHTQDTFLADQLATACRDVVTRSVTAFDRAQAVLARAAQAGALGLGMSRRGNGIAPMPPPTASHEWRGHCSEISMSFLSSEVRLDALMGLFCEDDEWISPVAQPITPAEPPAGPEIRVFTSADSLGAPSHVGPAPCAEMESQSFSVLAPCWVEQRWLAPTMGFAAPLKRSKQISSTLDLLRGSDFHEQHGGREGGCYPPPSSAEGVAQVGPDQWQAQFLAEGHIHWVGTFSSRREAVTAHDAAVRVASALWALFGAEDEATPPPTDSIASSWLVTQAASLDEESLERTRVAAQTLHHGEVAVQTIDSLTTTSCLPAVAQAIQGQHPQELLHGTPRGEAMSVLAAFVLRDSGIIDWLEDDEHERGYQEESIAWIPTPLTSRMSTLHTVVDCCVWNRRGAWATVATAREVQPTNEAVLLRFRDDCEEEDPASQPDDQDNDDADAMDVIELLDEPEECLVEAKVPPGTPCQLDRVHEISPEWRLAFDEAALHFLQLVLLLQRDADGAGHPPARLEMALRPQLPPSLCCWAPQSPLEVVAIDHVEEETGEDNDEDYSEEEEWGLFRGNLASLLELDILRDCQGQDPLFLASIRTHELSLSQGDPLHLLSNADAAVCVIDWLAQLLSESRSFQGRRAVTTWSLPDISTQAAKAVQLKQGQFGSNPWISSPAERDVTADASMFGGGLHLETLQLVPSLELMMAKLNRTCGAMSRALGIQQDDLDVWLKRGQQQWVVFHQINARVRQYLRQLRRLIRRPRKTYAPLACYKDRSVSSGLGITPEQVAKLKQQLPQGRAVRKPPVSRSRPKKPLTRVSSRAVSGPPANVVTSDSAIGPRWTFPDELQDASALPKSLHSLELAVKERFPSSDWQALSVSLFADTARCTVCGVSGDVDHPKVGPTLRCRSCSCVVHAGCYGATASDAWECDMCAGGRTALVDPLDGPLSDQFNDRCALCHHKPAGLASKPCRGFGKGGWVHLVCAITCSLVRWQDRTRWHGPDVVLAAASAASMADARLKMCHLCNQDITPVEAVDCCPTSARVQLFRGPEGKVRLSRCNRQMHASCALRGGCLRALVPVVPVVGEWDGDRRDPAVERQLVSVLEGQRSAAPPRPKKIVRGKDASPWIGTDALSHVTRLFAAAPRSYYSYRVANLDDERFDSAAVPGDVVALLGEQECKNFQRRAPYIARCLCPEHSLEPTDRFRVVCGRDAGTARSIPVPSWWRGLAHPSRKSAVYGVPAAGSLGPQDTLVVRGVTTTGLLAKQARTDVVLSLPNVYQWALSSAPAVKTDQETPPASPVPPPVAPATAPKAIKRPRSPEAVSQDDRMIILARCSKEPSSTPPPHDKQQPPTPPAHGKQQHPTPPARRSTRGGLASLEDNELSRAIAASLSGWT